MTRQTTPENFQELLAILRRKGLGSNKLQDLSVDSLTSTNDIKTTAGGISTVSAVNPAAGDVVYSTNLRPYRSATQYTAYAYVPLTTSLTNASWLGNARSTTAATLIGLNSNFSVPTAARAINATVFVRDSGSAARTTFTGVSLSPNTTITNGVQFSCEGETNDRWRRSSALVNCDSSGQIYYTIAASGSLTCDVFIYITGYYL